MSLAFARFIETPRFPDHIMAWATGGPSWNTTVATNIGGREKRNINWIQARHRYNISAGLRVLEDSQITLDFFNMARGKANGFRVRPRDNLVTYESDRGFIGDAQGQIGYGYYFEDEYQLFKKYTLPGLFNDPQDELNYSYYHKITKPEFDEHIKVYVDGVEVEENVVWTYNPATGMVKFLQQLDGEAGDPNILRWSGRYDLPVRFESDLSEVGSDPGGLLNWDNITLIELRDEV